MIYQLTNWTSLIKIMSRFQICSRYFINAIINRSVYTESINFHRILTPETKEIAKIFQSYGYELRIVGGAIRDFLIGKWPDDYDFATTATPEQMKEMFKTEGVQQINNKGELHGNMFIHWNNKDFHITTLRVDAKTDGRHADVLFTKDWQLDASRRDFTINSLYLDFDGVIYDYSGGLKDLKIRRVAFIGDPSKRIQEDYLRILRYFRFFGRIAIEPGLHEIETLNAIKENIYGLAKLSGQKIWIEMKKILAGNHSREIIETMIELGISPYIGLPKSPAINEFKKVCDRCILNPHSITLLTALLHDVDDLENLNLRLKFSKDEKNLASFIIKNRANENFENELKSYQHLVSEAKSKQKQEMKKWICELIKYKGNNKLLESFQM